MKFGSFKNQVAVRADSGQPQVPAGQLSQSGATLLEFALALPLLLAMMLGVIDISRYFLSTAILHTAAKRGVDAARKVQDFDIDFRNRSNLDADYRRFVAARAEAIREATTLPLTTLFSPSEHPSTATLEQVRQIDSGMFEGVEWSAPQAASGAAVLRPGDCVMIGNVGRVCNRETLPVSDADPLPDITPADLMRNHPIRVEVWAYIKPLFPFVPPVRVKGVATDYREFTPRGPTTEQMEPVQDVGSVASGTSDPLPPALAAPVQNQALTTCQQSWDFCLRTYIAQTVPPKKPARMADARFPDKCGCINISSAEEGSLEGNPG